jgi:hypothetical protein
VAWHAVRAPDAARPLISRLTRFGTTTAVHRNYYKVEKWTKDGSKVDRTLYAGNNPDRARQLFTEAVKHRPRIKLTIRQRTRVLQEWPVI